MITKISPIIPIKTIINPQKPKKDTISQNGEYNFWPQNFSNKFLVNFTSREYFQTLRENYYKLPPNATPDIFQKVAAMNILNDNDVIVTAPTGTGKTAIAMYAISKNMADGTKTFYTTPLKALSNEKFKSFQNIYGDV